MRRVKDSAKVVIYGDRPKLLDNGLELQTGYVFFQEFLPENDFDTRVTVIGNKAFAYRHFAQLSDFRASGSGSFSVDPLQVDEKFIFLAFNAVKKINSKSCAVDGLYKNKKPVLVEIIYTYVSWMVHTCPGHWLLDEDLASSNLKWVEGHMKSEEAQIEDFIELLESRYGK